MNAPTKITNPDRPASHLVEHLLSLARALNTEILQDAGHEPEYDGVTCKTCGVPTEDDGDKYCAACMPVCVECESPDNSLDSDGICESCLERRHGWPSRQDQLRARSDYFLELMLGK